MLDSGEYEECDYGVVIDVYQLLPKDYAAHISGKDCIDIVNISRMIKEQCILYGFPYYETSYERDKVLDKFMTEHIK